MNYLDWFNALFNTVFFMIGVWTAISWMHKQLYIFKNAIALKKVWDETGIKGSLLECVWRIKDTVETEKTHKNRI